MRSRLRWPAMPAPGRLLWWGPWLAFDGCFVFHVCGEPSSRPWDVDLAVTQLVLAVMAVLALECRHAAKVRDGTAEVLLINSGRAGDAAAMRAQIAELRSEVSVLTARAEDAERRLDGYDTGFAIIGRGHLPKRRLLQVVRDRRGAV